MDRRRLAWLKIVLDRMASCEREDCRIRAQARDLFGPEAIAGPNVRRSRATLEDIAGNGCRRIKEGSSRTRSAGPRASARASFCWRFPASGAEPNSARHQKGVRWWCSGFGSDGFGWASSIRFCHARSTGLAVSMLGVWIAAAAPNGLKMAKWDSAPFRRRSINEQPRPLTARA